MSKIIQETLRDGLQGLVDAGIPTKPFTKKRLNELGIVLPVIKMSPSKIKRVRKSTNLSQSVFAQMLNVSLASIRHWEQGVRQPSGSTKVLLELLNKDSHALDHFLPKTMKAA